VYLLQKMYKVELRNCLQTLLKSERGGEP